MALRPVNIVCFRCQQSEYSIPNVDLVGYTGGEVFDAVTPALLKANWSVKVLDDKSKRVAICPKCLEAAKIVVANMRPFSRETGCDKCGCRELSVKYKTGREPDALVEDEHLERTCSQCGYKVAQATLDRA